MKSTEDKQVMKENVNPADANEENYRLPVMKLVIESIELKDLKDTGTFLDPQDPCVHITIGRNVYKTKRKPDAGTSATFDDTIEIKITDEEYFGQVTLEVFNEHVTGLKKHVGVVTSHVRTIWPSKNYPSTYTLLLINKNSKKNDKQRGIATITGTVIDDRSLLDECSCTVS